MFAYISPRCWWSTEFEGCDMLSQHTTRICDSCMVFRNDGCLEGKQEEEEEPDSGEDKESEGRDEESDASAQEAQSNNSAEDEEEEQEGDMQRR